MIICVDNFGLFLFFSLYVCYCASVFVSDCLRLSSRMTILSSRESTCIHPQVAAYPNKNEACADMLDVSLPYRLFNFVSFICKV